MKKMDPEYDVKRFNRWAASYDQSIVHRWYFGPIHSKMLEMIQKERPQFAFGSILDVGCGTGRFLRAAAKCWPQAQLIGVDPAERMIAEATPLNPKAVFKLAPAEAIPLPDETADLVVTSLSFHHWLDQEKGLREISRVLRPGGLFCLADHTVRLPRFIHERARSRREIQALMSRAGFTILRQRRLWLRFVLITLATKSPSRHSV